MSSEGSQNLLGIDNKEVYNEEKSIGEERGRFCGQYHITYSLW